MASEWTKQHLDTLFAPRADAPTEKCPVCKKFSKKHSPFIHYWSLAQAVGVGGAGGTIAPETPAPENLVAAGTSNLNEVGLTWDTVAHADSYNVYEGATGQETVLAEDVLTNSYTDTSADTPGTRFYVVTAVKNGIESGPSNEVRVVMIPPSVVQQSTFVHADNYGANIAMWPKAVIAGNTVLIGAVGLTSDSATTVTNVSDGQSTYSTAWQTHGSDTAKTWSSGLYYLQDTVGGNPTPGVRYSVPGSVNVKSLEVSGLFPQAPTHATGSGSGTITTAGNVTISETPDLRITGYASKVAGGFSHYPSGYIPFFNHAEGAQVLQMSSVSGVVSPTFLLQPQYPTGWVDGFASFAGGCTVSTGNIYHLSPNGNDANDGLTPQTPWKTLAKASGATYAPGDTLALLAGATFSGSLTINTTNFSTLPSVMLPFFLETYGGTAKATIDGGDQTSVFFQDVPSVYINNIYTLNSGVQVVLVGDPDNTSSTTCVGYGIYFLNTGTLRLDGPVISNCETNGALIGINLIADNTHKMGFQNFSFTNCKVHDNFLWGISVRLNSLSIPDLQGSDIFLNMQMVGCEVYNIWGDSEATIATNTGWGGHIFTVGNYLVSGCCFHDNGVTSSPISISGGPVGFDSQGSHDALIEFCEAYHQHAQDHVDGEGFDPDGGSIDVTVFACYSHDNAGFGFSTGSLPGWAAQARIKFINCVSENNQLNVSSYGQEFRFGGDNWLDNTTVEVTNCTAFSNHDTNAFAVIGNSISNSNVNVKAVVSNTIIMCHGSSAFFAMREGDILLGNIYSNPDGFVGTYVNSGGTDTYTSLAGMHTAAIQGIEHLGSTNYGQQGTPTLSNPGGGSPQLMDFPVSHLTAYDPLGGSISINNGIDAAGLLGVTVSPVDFHGNPNVIAGQWDVGAVKKQ